MVERVSEDLGYCFHGSYARSVDKKGRFNLPFRFRRDGAVGDEKYVVSNGPDGTLTLLPYQEWLHAFTRLRQQKSDRRLGRTPLGGPH